MDFVYETQHNRQCATNLRCDHGSGNLNWDAGKGHDVVVVQTSFGHSPISHMEREIVPAMNDVQLPLDCFAEVLDGVRVRLLTATDKVKYSGCPLDGEACTYTVFSTSGFQEKPCYVYEPPVSAMMSPICDVPMRMRVTVEKVMQQSGLFMRKEVDTGFYSLSFDRSAADSYLDGSLVYSVGEFVIPVTRRVIEQGVVYVKSFEQPIVQSCNPGLQLI